MIMRCKNCLYGPYPGTKSSEIDKPCSFCAHVWPGGDDHWEPSASRSARPRERVHARIEAKKEGT